MKKLLILSVLAMAMSGCDNTNKPIKNNGDTMEQGFTGYRLEFIEGCEYLSYDRSLTHKGNCKNPIHSYSEKNTILNYERYEMFLNQMQGVKDKEKIKRLSDSLSKYRIK